MAHITPRDLSSTPVTTRSIPRPVEGAMEDLTYHSGMLRVGITSEDFAEPITDASARTFKRRISELSLVSNFPQPANEN
jgi:hypothetical protein